MIRATAAISVRAPAAAVREIFADFGRWPAVFPMISAVQLVCGPRGTVTVLVSHRRHGEVLNQLTEGPDGALILEEQKPSYHARFVNEFVPDGDGASRIVIRAQIRLKGARRLVSPFLWPLARRQMRLLTLEPLRRAAEAAAAGPGAAKDGSGGPG